MHRGSLLTNKLVYMDDFFIRVMQMGELICMDVVGYDLYG